MPARSLSHPSELTSDQRFRHLAAILAQGVLRWRQLAHLAAVENLSQSPLRGLEVLSETRLSVCVGFDPDLETTNAR